MRSVIRGIRKPQKILKEIEEASRGQFLPIIGPKKGKLLVELIKKHKPKRVLEVGTLVGYSSILIAQNMPKGGKIVSIEISPKMAKVARENLREASLDHIVEVKAGNALDIIPRLKGNFDFLFLDAAKEEYFDYLREAESKLEKEAIIVADNVKMFADDMKEYLDYVRIGGKYESKTFDFGSDAMEVSKLAASSNEK